MSIALDNSEKLLTRLEAAEFLRGYIHSGSKSWLASLAVRNEGPPFIVVARKALYRPDDLRDWVNERFLSAKAINSSSPDEPIVTDHLSGINTDAIELGLRLVAQLGA